MTAHESPREPTRDQDSPEEHRKAEESTREFREAQERQFWMAWQFWMGIQTCNVTMGTCAPEKALEVLKKC